jgi:hypothetical protein
VERRLQFRLPLLFLVATATAFDLLTRQQASDRACLSARCTTGHKRDFQLPAASSPGRGPPNLFRLRQTLLFCVELYCSFTAALGPSPTLVTTCHHRSAWLGHRRSLRQAHAVVVVVVVAAAATHTQRRALFRLLRADVEQESRYVGAVLSGWASRHKAEVTRTPGVLASVVRKDLPITCGRQSSRRLSSLTNTEYCGSGLGSKSR